MRDVMLRTCNLDQERLEQVISIGVFGSYHEKRFNKEHSDIDIIILLKEELHWEQEFEIEEYLESELPRYFKHNNMHYTFVNGFNYPFSELLLISEDKIIIDEEKYLDYVLGYSCFKRDRENLEIIREKNLKDLEELKNGIL
ncbi:MAG: nucleotidyltransferase domain-containing protein [Cellulosilyticaceae bacterium]